MRTDLKQNPTRIKTTHPRTCGVASFHSPWSIFKSDQNKLALMEDPLYAFPASKFATPRLHNPQVPCINNPKACLGLNTSETCLIHFIVNEWFSDEFLGRPSFVGLSYKKWELILLSHALIVLVHKIVNSIKQTCAWNTPKMLQMLVTLLKLIIISSILKYQYRPPKQSIVWGNMLFFSMSWVKIEVRESPGGGHWYFKLTGVVPRPSKKMGAKERPIKEKEGLGSWPIKEKEGLGSWPLKEKEGLENWLIREKEGLGSWPIKGKKRV